MMKWGTMLNIRLKEIRRERGLTQMKLSEMIGIDQALISKYESGGRVPPTEALIAFADVFGVSIDYLVGRTNKPDVYR